MRDPRDCHGAECAGCGGWFRDEDDVNEDMLCESCEADALSTAYDDALAAYHEADEAVTVAKADVAVLVPLYADLLEAHAAMEAARAAAGVTPPARDWLAVAADITGTAR